MLEKLAENVPEEFPKEDITKYINKMAFLRYLGNLLGGLDLGKLAGLADAKKKAEEASKGKKKFTPDEGDDEDAAPPEELKFDRLKIMNYDDLTGLKCINKY